MFDFLKKPKSPEEIAKKITRSVADSAFKFYRNKTFRAYTDLETLDKTEQDRIFNELVVNGLVLGIMMLSAMTEKSKTTRAQNFYHELMIELSSSYSNWLRELGTEESFCQMWQELIKMRFDEYDKDCQKYQKEIGDLFEKSPWAFVTAIGCHHHIRRGKAKLKDPLFKLILVWIVDNAKTITNILDKSI